MNNQSNIQNELNRILEKINEIVEKSAEGDYIYRGEAEYFEKISSSLYREYPHAEGERFDIERDQAAILDEAKEYTSESDPIKILTELQHFGGKTNLIDFTEDYLIALFFACNGSHEKPGRVILQKRESENYEIEEAPNTIKRAEYQKSVFVQSPDGFIEPEIEVDIPIDLKFPMLEYLRKYHRISAERIYNDLHGFIRRSASTEFLKGLTCQAKGDKARSNKEKQECYEDTINHYTEALKLKPNYIELYNNRGNAYRDIGEYDLAIQDYDEIIKRQPDFIEVRVNRGLAYFDKGERDLAFQDYNAVIEQNPEFVRAYLNRGAAYDKEGKHDKAIEDYTKAIQRKPNYPEAYYNRGFAQDRKNERNLAIEDYTKAIQLNPRFTKAYRDRGIAYDKRGDFGEAIADYTKAIELEPDDAGTYFNRGSMY